MKKVFSVLVSALLAVTLVSSVALTALAASNGATTEKENSRSSRVANTASRLDSSGATTAEREKRGQHGQKSGVQVDVISVAAEVLGKTKDEVRSALRTGKVGDLLIAAGKVDAFKAAYLTELKSKLDAAVSAGTLTQEKADEHYASGKEKMDRYDGTTHLCGGNDHSKMREKKR